MKLNVLVAAIFFAPLVMGDNLRGLSRALGKGENNGKNNLCVDEVLGVDDIYLGEAKNDSCDHKGAGAYMHRKGDVKFCCKARPQPQGPKYKCIKEKWECVPDPSGFDDDGCCEGLYCQGAKNEATEGVCTEKTCADFPHLETCGDPDPVSPCGPGVMCTCADDGCFATPYNNYLVCCCITNGESCGDGDNDKYCCDGLECLETGELDESGNPVKLCA